MSETKLKPCPFCGGQAEFYRTPIKSNGGWCDSVVVRCKECEARTNRILYDAKKHQNDGEYDEAAMSWNTRKAGIERVLERLEKEKTKLRNARKKLVEKMCFDKAAFNRAQVLQAKEITLHEAIEIIKEEVKQMKALLIIDMPKSCAECKISIEDDLGLCCPYLKCEVDENEIDLDCPLEQLPNKGEGGIS